MARVRIMNFHGIGTPDRSLRSDEVAYWLSEDQFQQTLDLIERLQETSDPILLTFDDSNASDLTIVAPELARRGMTASFFILTGRIGQAGSLDADDIRTLRGMGHRIGSHGVDHLDWRKLDNKGLRHELRESLEVLSDICHEPITSAGIPFGGYNRRVLTALRSSGYKSAYTSDGGAADDAVFLRPRTSVRADMDLSELKAILTGSEAFGRRLRRFVGKARKRLLP